MKISTFMPVRLFCTVLAVAVVATTSFTAALAVEIKTVVTPKGIKVLLVEDYTVPLVAMAWSFKGGSTQDLAGKEGTAELLTNMLDEGAGNINSQEFQEALQDNGMIYSFNATQDSWAGSVKTIKSESARSFELLTLMLNSPRFDEDPMDRMRASRLNGLKQQEADPQSIASRAFSETLFPGHPYARPGDGTIETMSGLTADDLRDFKKRVFARDNLVVGVVGAINEEELKATVDQVFGNLPEKAQLNDVAEVTIKTGDTKHIDFNTPQTNIRMALPGMKRDNPEFYAAYIANYILGGGSFSSRLYEEVREKRGLAYGVYSYLGTYDYTGIVGGGSATGADRAQQTVDVMLEEIARMAKDGPTEEELVKAKKYIIGSYAIANLDTSDKIASVLVAIQDANLGVDYIDKRAGYIDAVTLDDVKKVSAKLFGGKPTVITVGKALN